MGSTPNWDTRTANREQVALDVAEYPACGRFGSHQFLQIIEQTDNRMRALSRTTPPHVD